MPNDTYKVPFPTTTLSWVTASAEATKAPSSTKSSSNEFHIRNVALAFLITLAVLAFVFGAILGGWTIVQRRRFHKRRRQRDEENQAPRKVQPPFPNLVESTAGKKAVDEANPSARPTRVETVGADDGPSSDTSTMLQLLANESPQNVANYLARYASSGGNMSLKKWLKSKKPLEQQLAEPSEWTAEHEMHHIPVTANDNGSFKTGFPSQSESIRPLSNTMLYQVGNVWFYIEDDDGHPVMNLRLLPKRKNAAERDRGRVRKLTWRARGRAKRSRQIQRCVKPHASTNNSGDACIQQAGANNLDSSVAKGEQSNVQPQELPCHEKRVNVDVLAGFDADFTDPDDDTFKIALDFEEDSDSEDV